MSRSPPARSEPTYANIPANDAHENVAAGENKSESEAEKAKDEDFIGDFS